jgi:hypothetical protein
LQTPQHDPQQPESISRQPDITHTIAARTIFDFIDDILVYKPGERQT